MSEQIQQKKKVFVGVSGGVDSSVALALLKDQGYDVVGVFIRTWQPEWIACTWRAERRDAMRVCAHLEVPFVELDLEREYKEGVADYMIEEYRKGRTPNPDVMCNREVKFGGFLRWAREHGGDYVATGHYARTEVRGDSTALLRGVDVSKDQSYFLWMLTQEELAHILFPIGSLPKTQVRALAASYGLPTATKADSQGICFIGDIDMKEFLRHYIDERPGLVLDIEGTPIGTHLGAHFFTLGERHGFIINPNHQGTDNQPRYVVGKDVDTNTITVSETYTSPVLSQTIALERMVDNQEQLTQGNQYRIELRYHGELMVASLETYDVLQKTGTLRFEEIAPLVASGQSIVLYQDEVCLGGGIVV